MKILKDEENMESKQFLEAVAVMSVLSEAKCKMPTFLEINLNLSEMKSRDKYFGLLVSAVESFTENFAKNTNDNGVVAILTSDEKPLKRSRRAAADVILHFIRQFVFNCD